MILYKMPKKEMDYSKTIIYKIVCNDLNITECYVGHTTNFVQRKNSHKCRCNCETNNYYNLKIYQTIRTNGGWDNWSMIEIEKYPCNDINEATARERHWYEQLNTNLNSKNPARTRKEYYETNKDQILDQYKEYRSKNKEQISEQRKEHYETNKEQISKQQKEYRETNKAQIRKKANQKFNCECGGKYIHNNKARHLNSQKHIDFMALKTDTIV